MKTKPIRKYTCTRRINKNGDRIWVVLEDGKKFYRIFRNQTLAIEYFKPLKTSAEMKVQQATGDYFSRVVFTNEEVNKKGFKNSSKNIKNELVKESDELFDESELKSETKPEPKEKKETKPKPKRKAKSKAKSKSKSKPVSEEKEEEKVIVKEIHYVEKVVRVDSNTGEIISDEKPEVIEEKILINEEEPVIENLAHDNDPKSNIDLISELEKLDEARIEEFAKQDTANISIIDEILSRKSMVENTWDENTSDDLTKEDTNNIYVKEDIDKKIVINSRKIDFNDAPDVTSTIEGIIDQKTKEINVKSVDYGRIKEYNDLERMTIEINNEDESKNKKINKKNTLILKDDKKTKLKDDKKNNSGISNTKFWVLTILFSLFIMLLIAGIVLLFFFFGK